MAVRDFKTATEIVRDLDAALRKGNGSVESYVKKLVDIQRRDRKAKPPKSYIVEIPPEHEGYKFDIVSICQSLPDPNQIMTHVVEKYGLPGEEWKVMKEWRNGDNLLRIRCRGLRPITVKRRESAKKKKKEQLQAILDGMTEEERREFFEKMG